MLTHKLGDEIFAWDPNAFGGKGYWFVLGKNGGLGRAVSRKEASSLGNPSKAEVEPVSEKVYEEKPAKASKSISYEKAARIRKTGLLELIAKKKFEEGQGLGSSISGAVSDKFKAKVKGIKEKFDPLNIVKGLTGEGAIGKSLRTIAGRAMGRSDEDIDYFGGYQRKKKKGTAEAVSATNTKIGSVEKGSSPADIIANLYELLKKSYDEKKTQYEIQRNFDEENKNEADRRHKELLKALGGITGKSTPTATKEKENSFVDNILNMFGLAKDALKFLPILGEIFLGPVGLALLGGAAIGAIIYSLWKNSDPEKVKDSLAGKGQESYAAAGLGSETQLPGWEDAEEDKSTQLKASQVDKKGIKKAELSELEAKLKQEMDYGHAKSPQVAELKKEIEERKKTKASASPQSPTTSAPSSTPSASPVSGAAAPSSPAPAPTASPASSQPPTSSAPAPTSSQSDTKATPVPSPNLGEKAVAATEENVKAQAESGGDNSPIVMNNSKTVSTQGKSDSGAIGPMSVRNDDPSLMRTQRTSLRTV